MVQTEWYSLPYRPTSLARSLFSPVETPKKKRTRKPCQGCKPCRPPRRDGRSTNARGGVLQSRRSRRARAEARVPMRGSSRVCRGVWRSRRCPVRCAALRGAARRRGGGALRAAAAPLRAAGALRPLRRRAAGAAPSSHGLLVPCARSVAGRPAAPSPPQPRPRSGQHRLGQIARERVHARAPHFFVAGPTRLATILPRASRPARPLPPTRMTAPLEERHRTASLFFVFPIPSF